MWTGLSSASQLDIWVDGIEKQLKALDKSLEELRSSASGKTKFAFKRKVKTPSSLSTKTATPARAITQTTTTTAHSTSRTISNCFNCYLSRSCLSGTSSTSSTNQIEVSITNMSSSVLNLLPSEDESTLPTNIISLSALHINDIQDSILILGHVDGSIMLHNLTNCVVVAGCHQVGIFSLQAMCFGNSACSQFAVQDAQFYGRRCIPRHRIKSDNRELWPCEVRSIPEPVECKFFLMHNRLQCQVLPQTSTSQQPLVINDHNLPFLPQDFSHIRATPSPNWRALKDDELVHDWPLGENDYALQLEKALPRPKTWWWLCIILLISRMRQRPYR